MASLLLNDYESIHWVSNKFKKATHSILCVFYGVNERELIMTPYEATLAKKLRQAVDLKHSLLIWRQLTGQDAFSEELILQAIVQRIKVVDQQFDSQLQRYQESSAERKRLACESEDSIKRLTERVWKDIYCQLASNTVVADVVKELYQKIQRFPLPAFPTNRQKPLLYKDVHLHEDSYTFLGQYFCWFIDWLSIVDFTPIRLPYTPQELSIKATHYVTLTQQVRKEADTLQAIQLTKTQLYKQLNQAMKAARKRMQMDKGEIRRFAS